MKQTTVPESVTRLYALLRDREYPEDFCRAVTQLMNTDYTARRLTRYLSHFGQSLPMEEIADEIVAILSEREKFIRKAEAEEANAAYTAYLNRKKRGED